MNKQLPTLSTSNLILDQLLPPENTIKYGSLFAQLTTYATEQYNDPFDNTPGLERPLIRVGTYSVPDKFKDAVKAVFEDYFEEIANHINFEEAEFLVFRNAILHKDMAFSDKYFLNVVVGSSGGVHICALDNMGFGDYQTSSMAPYMVDPKPGDCFVLDPTGWHTASQTTDALGVTVLLQFVINREPFGTIYL